MAFADDVEVVKGNEDMSDHDNEVDQVALESEHDPQNQKVLYQHNLQQQQQQQQQPQQQGPGPARSNYNYLVNPLKSKIYSSTIIF